MMEGFDEGTDVRQRTRWERIRGSKILLVCIALHLLFGLAAGYWIVERSQAKRKLTFQAAAGPAQASTRALEHQINMSRKMQSMSAPAQARRITTTGLAKITLPEMPAMPEATDITPDKMAGMGGMGVGIGLAGAGGGGGGGNGNGKGMTLFGMHETQSAALEGHFYDLKQTPDRRDSGVTNNMYTDIVQDFVKTGWHESKLQKYYKASLTLYATQIFTPEFPADLAPKAFGVEKEVKASRWVALYKGLVSPPETGNYFFVGAGDDVMMVRFQGRNVLDRCWEMQLENKKPVATVTANYSYDWPAPGFGSIPNGFARGEPISVEKGEYYPIEILVGEQPGGCSGFCLLIEKEGEEYEKDPKGNPIIPIFRLAKQPLLPVQGEGKYPPYQEDGPIWLAKKPNPVDSLMGGDQQGDLLPQQ